MRKIDLFEFSGEFGPIDSIEILLLFPAQRVQMIEAIVPDGFDQIGLGVFDLLLFGTEPLNESILDNIFRVRFAFKDLKRNRMKKGLVQRYGLSLIQLELSGQRYVFLRD